MKSNLLINELAKEVDLTPKTIRFYEEIGIIPKPERNESNYRIYKQEDIKKIAFVKKSRDLGLSLEEIKSIMDIREKGNYPCNTVIDLMENQIISLEIKIKEMTEFKETLKKSVVNFKEHIDVGKKGNICGLIENLFE